MSNETERMDKLDALIADVETRARKAEASESSASLYSHFPDYCNSVDMTAEKGNLIAFTDTGVMTSAAAPYIRHYVIQMESRKQKIPAPVADAILGYNRGMLDVYYGKDGTDIMLDRVKKYATPQLSIEDLGIGSIEIDFEDLAA